MWNEKGQTLLPVCRKKVALLLLSLLEHKDKKIALIIWYQTDHCKHFGRVWCQFVLKRIGNVPFADQYRLFPLLSGEDVLRLNL